MRFGSNPQRGRGGTSEGPAAITVGVLNHIPDQEGYFEGQVESLELCLASLRAHADEPFELLVVDNTSCREVKRYLLGEQESGRIDYLVSQPAQRRGGQRHPADAAIRLRLAAPRAGPIGCGAASACAA